MEQHFIYKQSELRTLAGEVKENFYVNRRSVPDSAALFHLQLWFDSEWKEYHCNNKVSENAMFLGLVLSGSQYRAQTENEQLLQAGDLLLERQNNEILQLRALPGKPLCRIGMLISRTAALEALVCSLFPEQTTVIHCLEPKKMKEHFMSIKEEITSSGGRAEMISQQLFCLLQEAVRQQKKNSFPEPLQRALDFITLNGFRQISREELAEHAGVSVRSLTNLFQTFCGVSPGRYMSRRRIEYAKELLASHKLTVADTARLAGFSSVEFFIREFRTHTGITPGKY
ncbi:MAG: helix-turn-helix transcriptional regulator [Lentisphaeria bacterium]|nr:helix-turn-helix transcriptional regulator [Lentisphaeria bacterium]